MDIESQKSLLIGMMSGLLLTLEKYMDDDQKELLTDINDCVKEIFYTENK